MSSVKALVVIADGWAVFHNGQQHHGGTALEVDVPTAEQWLAAGWAVTPPKKTSRSREAIA